MSFKTPSIIPVATPNATAIINMDFLNAPFVKFCTVIPRAFRAGSARVAERPRTQANKAAMPTPTAMLYSGLAVIASIDVKAPAINPPD